MTKYVNGVQLPPRLVFQDRLAAALVEAARAGHGVAVVCRNGSAPDGSELDRLLAQLGLREVSSLSLFDGRAWALAQLTDGHPAAAPNGLGWASYPRDGHDPDVLMQAALDATQDGPVVGPAQTAADAGADSASDWSLRYQPQVELASGRVIGFEALQNHPNAGKAPRLETLIALISDDLEHFRRRARAQHRIAINLALPQIASEWGHALLEQHAAALAAGGVEIEVTESRPAESLAQAELHMAALRAQGLRFALDDFGAGFATTTLLERLPFDTLKIDKRYIAWLDFRGCERGGRSRRDHRHGGRTGAQQRLAGGRRGHRAASSSRAAN